MTKAQAQNYAARKDANRFELSGGKYQSGLTYVTALLVPRAPAFGRFQLTPQRRPSGLIWGYGVERICDNPDRQPPVRPF